MAGSYLPNVSFASSNQFTTRIIAALSGRWSWKVRTREKAPGSHIPRELIRAYRGRCPHRVWRLLSG